MTNEIFAELKKDVDSSCSLKPVQGMPQPTREIDKKVLDALGPLLQKHEDCDCVSCLPWTY